MPGGTSGEGKTPTQQQAAADKQRRKGSGSSSSSDSDALAMILAAVQQAANQSSVESSIAQQASMDTTFNPQEFLKAKNALNAAWADTTDGDADELTPQERPAYFGPIPYPNGVPASATDPSQGTAVKEAQAAYDQQLRTRRADALNVDPNGKPVKLKEEIERLSWDEYNNLTPLQQAAVDYNSMLVKAIRQDRKNQDTYTPTADETTAYEGALTEMFGSAEKGSDTYAPATMGVLRQIGYKGDGSGELDDFLNLNATLGVKDLKRLDNAQDLGLRRTGEGGMYGNPVMEERMDLLGQLARDTQDAQAAALIKGNEILKNFSTVAVEQARADDVARLGGLDSTIVPSNEKKATNFSGFFDLLADADLEAKGVPISQLFATLQDSMNEKEQDQFIKYVKGRLVEAAANPELPITESTNVQTARTPEEIAKLLKLDGFTRGGA